MPHSDAPTQITSVAAGPGRRQGLWHNFGVEDGLPTSSIVSLAQDQRGDLWLGTFLSGLCRYDGAQFTTFTGWNDRPDQVSWFLLADRQGRIWFSAATDDLGRSDIYTFDGEQSATADGPYAAFPARRQIPHKNVLPLLEDRRGDLWFFATEESPGFNWSAGDLYRYDGRELAAFTAGGALPESGVITLCEDRHGHLWFGTVDGVYRYDGAECTALDADLSNTAVCSLLEDRHGHLWFISGTDLHRYDGTQVDTLPIPNAREDMRNGNLVEDRAGHLWFSLFSSGVYRYDSQTLTHFTTLDGLAHNTVLDLLVDRDGSLWCATHSGGISRYDGAQVQNFTTEDGLGANHTYSIFEDRRDHLWIGTHDGGVSHYDGARLETFAQDYGPGNHGGWHTRNNTVWGISQDRQGRLFFSNIGNGFTLCDSALDFRHIALEDQTETYGTFTLFVDSRDRLWLSCVQETYRGHVLRCDDASKIGISHDATPRQFVAIEPNDGAELNRVSYCELRDGELLIISLNGIYRCEGDKLVAFRWNQNPWPRGIQAVCQDRQGRLWVGSRYIGLHRYDDQGTTAYTMRDGLAENHIRCIVEDDRGHLWIGTFGGGVSRFDGLVFQRLSRHDGLVHDTVNDVHQARDGAFWIATEGGLTRYRPQQTNPTIHLTDLVADHRYGPVDELQLLASQRFVSFEFQGRSFSTSPDRMAYVYRLIGYQDEWRPCYQRRVDFHISQMGASHSDPAHLPLGDYTFEVKAVDRDLNYSEPASVRLAIVPDERDRRIDELEQRVSERTAALAAANTRLARENAVERVRTQVFSMQQAEDLDQVVLALGRELQSLGISYHTCGLQILGEGGAHAERIALRAQGSAIERGQTSGWPAESSVYKAWDKQRVVYRADLQKDNPYKEDSLLRAGVRAVVDVPFRYGTLALSSERPEAFWPPDIEILQAFAAAIEGAYTRYLDFQALAESNRQIQQATQHKSDFLARMSHDLRTPMNAIIGYTRILIRRAKDTLDPRQFHNLENIETSAQNLLKLINEILDLSRIEAGRVEVHAADVDMQQLVAECATAIMPLVRPEVELIQDLADAPALYTDAALMRRVVMNILSNAVKFTDTGRITVALTTADKGLTLTIADTGPGIPASDLPHIFEEFRQVEGESAIKTQEGSGLGLAIVKGTIELLGGTIAAESTVGEGTTFILSIASYQAP